MRKEPLNAKKKGIVPFRVASRQEGSTMKLKARADKKREPKKE
jgi:hypothetical protein